MLLQHSVLPNLVAKTTKRIMNMEIINESFEQWFNGNQLTTDDTTNNQLLTKAQSILTVRKGMDQ